MSFDKGIDRLVMSPMIAPSEIYLNLFICDLAETL